MEIIEKFKYYIDDEFFCITENKKRLRLVENKGTPYEVVMNVDKQNSKYLIIHN